MKKICPISSKRDHTVEGRRYRDIIWGRKESQVLWRGGILVMERGREQGTGHCIRKTLSQTIDVENEIG